MTEREIDILTVPDSPALGVAVDRLIERLEREAQAQEQTR